MYLAQRKLLHKWWPQSRHLPMSVHPVCAEQQKFVSEKRCWCSAGIQRRCHMTDCQPPDNWWPVQRLGQPCGADEVVDAVLGLHTRVAQLYQNFRSLLGTAAEFQTANEGTSSWRNVSRRMEVSVRPRLALCCVKRFKV